MRGESSSTRFARLMESAIRAALRPNTQNDELRAIRINYLQTRNYDIDNIISLPLDELNELADMELSKE